MQTVLSSQAWGWLCKPSLTLAKGASGVFLLIFLQDFILINCKVDRSSSHLISYGYTLPSNNCSDLPVITRRLQVSICRKAKGSSQARLYMFLAFLNPSRGSQVSVSSRLLQSTQQITGTPELHSEALSQRRRRKRGREGGRGRKREEEEEERRKY